MKLNAGKYRHRIHFTRQQRVTNVAGETIEQHVEFAAGVPANVRQPSNREQVRNGQTVTDDTIIAEIRYRKDITTACQINYAGKVYAISAVIDRTQDRKELEVTATATRRA